LAFWYGEFVFCLPTRFVFIFHRFKKDNTTLDRDAMPGLEE